MTEPPTKRFPHFFDWIIIDTCDLTLAVLFELNTHEASFLLGFSRLHHLLQQDGLLSLDDLRFRHDRRVFVKETLYVISLYHKIAIELESDCLAAKELKKNVCIRYEQYLLDLMLLLISDRSDPPRTWRRQSDETKLTLLPLRCHDYISRALHTLRCLNRPIAACALRKNLTIVVVVVFVPD